MRFDEWWSDDDDQRAPADDLPLLADGRHIAEVHSAKIEDVKFKVSDRNAAGTSLVIVTAVSGFRPIKTFVPVQFRGQIEAICRAARQPVPMRGEEWQPDVLVGAMVDIETVLGIGKSGNEYVRVDRWYPGPEPAPKPKPAARTPAAKVAAAGQKGASDDIPF